MSSLKIALAQSSFGVGDIRGNALTMIATAQRARDELGADLVVFPELALTGCPPEDLLLRADLEQQIHDELQHIMAEVDGITVCLGAPVTEQGQRYNAALVLEEGRLLGCYHKVCLSQSGYFDEKGYFCSGGSPLVFELKGTRIGVLIGDDLSSKEPAYLANAAGAELLIHLSASPYYLGKTERHDAVVQQRISETRLPLVTVNLVGGQDELVFDGGSAVYDHTGVLALRLPLFAEELVVARFQLSKGDHVPMPRQAPIDPPLSLEAEVYRAIVTATRDYVRTNGFAGALIGLSGGIDSALALAIAVDALGKDQVEAIMMSGQYTASISQEDAAEQARRMGVTYSDLPIELPMRAFETALEHRFAGLPIDTTEENIQARCRGVLLMAVSNKTGKVVLTTSNKSEIAVGYTTLYGDMVGGFAPLKDVPKMWVYRLAAYRNSLGEVIPERVLTRPPSAELRPDQKDDDSLPPYPVLDAILEAYVEHDRSVAELVAAGFDETVVRDVIRRVDGNEFKRRQSAPGVKISRRTFGRERRYPMTHRMSHK